MALLAKELEVVAVSVIENFLCDALGSQPDQADMSVFDHKVNLVCQDFVETIKVCAMRLPDTILLIAKPLSRPRHKWFMESYDRISSRLLRAFHKFRLKNVDLVECLERKDLIFQLDQIHLDKVSGEKFVKNLIGAVNTAVRDKDSRIDAGLDGDDVDDETDED